MQVLIDMMKLDANWGMVSDLFDPIALLKLYEKLVLKQFDNQYMTADLIDKQLPILHLQRQDGQVSNATYYNQFTTKVEVTR
jgi:hypothetical protein